MVSRVFFFFFFQYFPTFLFIDLDNKQENTATKIVIQELQIF